MDRGVHFNKIHVIESLPEGDLKTGSALVENQLDHAKVVYPDLHIALHTSETKDGFLNVLAEIRDETSDHAFYPMLHIECHGAPEGLTMANGELVAWDDLRDTLIEINEACRLNLMIVLASCNGAHLINASKKMDRAPFWGIVAPEHEVIAGQIQRDFRAFYECFFQSLDGDAALAALNGHVPRQERTYHLLPVERLFVRAFATYYRDHCKGRGKRERVEELTTQAMQSPDVRRKGVKWARNNIKKVLTENEDHFRSLKDRFFFVDRFPENEERFPCTLDDVREAMEL